MKWPWPRKIREQIAEAEEAADQAQRDLAVSRAVRPIVDRAAEGLRAHRERNHLTELFEQLINPERG